jgi:hypothetical protein
VTFATVPHRMAPQVFLDYEGWCGHQHAPNQPTGHWDPGAIDIDDLIKRAELMS